MPPVNATTIGGTLTIAQLRALYHGVNIHFTQDISVYATVTMTDNYKTLYIRDNTGAISLKQLTAHGINEGDSLRLNLNGSWLDLSGPASSLQIDSFDVSSSATNKAVKLAVGKEHPPINVSILQLNSSASNISYSTPGGINTVPQSMYDGQLVKVNDIQFAFTDSGNYIPLNTSQLYLNHPVYDCGAQNTITMSLYSGTGDFLYQKVPHTKSGYMIAAVTFYNGALQLTPRSFVDIVFNQPRCGLDTLTQSFNNTSFGVGTNFSSSLFPGWYDIKQIGNSVDWQSASYGSVVFPSISTHFSNNSRNVVWLITPPMQSSATKNLSFSAGTAYNSTGKNQLSVLISTDFNGINTPGTSGTAHWTDITSAFPNIPVSNSSSSFVFANASASPVSLSPYLAGYTGTFYIGFRYTGNLTDSVATYGIKDVSIKN